MFSSSSFFTILLLCLQGSDVQALSVGSQFTSSVYAQVTLGISVALIVLIGIYVIVMAKKTGQPKDAEEFITARHTQGTLAIGFSFYASAVGAWVISGPADYAYWSGLIGAFMYAFAAAIPILFLALFGESIRNRFPGVLSMSDFAKLRFGIITQILVVLISLLNMSIAAIAEYTTIASLFSLYVGLGSYDIFVILLVAIVTLTYTTFGGLRVSIITDKVQATMSLFLVLVLAIYIMATFRLPENAEFTDQLKGLTVGGYSSIFTMPLSMVCATIFSEAMWQRVWASVDKKTLWIGSLMSSCMIFIVILFFGLLGIMGAMAERTDEATDPNLRVFAVINSEYEANKDRAEPIVSSVMGCFVIILAVTMNESAIDSLQNGLGASLSGAVAGRAESRFSYVLSSVWFTRVTVVLINIPLIAVATQKYAVMSLFLVANIVTVMACFPLALGFMDLGKLSTYLVDMVPISSIIITVIGSTIYGTNDVWDDSLSLGENIAAGLSMVFFDNFYRWDYFLVPLCCSILGTGISIVLVMGLQKCLPHVAWFHQNKELATETTLHVYGHKEEDDDIDVAQHLPLGTMNASKHPKDFESRVQQSEVSFDVQDDNI